MHVNAAGSKGTRALEIMGAPDVKLKQCHTATRDGDLVDDDGHKQPHIGFAPGADAVGDMLPGEVTDDGREASR